MKQSSAAKWCAEHLETDDLKRTLGNSWDAGVGDPKPKVAAKFGQNLQGLLAALKRRHLVQLVKSWVEESMPASRVIMLHQARREDLAAALTAFLIDDWRVPANVQRASPTERGCPIVTLDRAPPRIGRRPKPTWFTERWLDSVKTDMTTQSLLTGDYPEIILHWTDVCTEWQQSYDTMRALELRIDQLVRDPSGVSSALQRRDRSDPIGARSEIHSAG